MPCLPWQLYFGAERLIFEFPPISLGHGTNSAPFENVETRSASRWQRNFRISGLHLPFSPISTLSAVSQRFMNNTHSLLSSFLFCHHDHAVELKNHGGITMKAKMY